MTIGQLIECLVGKAAAIQGMDADGTAFEEHDIDYVKNTLKKFGYDENGYEELYNGMTGEKLKVKTYIGPTFYQRLKHLVEDKLHCLTSTHEVLTLSGWKFINTITYDDEILTLNKNGFTEYQKPTDLHNYENYNGKLYCVKSNDIDLITTMNHRMYVSKDGKTFDFVYAEDLIGQPFYYKNKTESIFVDPTNENVSETIINSDGKSVHCVSVPNEVFYIRHNGKACWTGNSRSRGPKTSLTRRNACLSHMTRYG